MALEKYKVCPACGFHNAPSLLECRQCEADLTGVRIVDAAAEQKAAEETVTEPVVEVESELVRVCECGAHNLPQARKCAACGEDISDILPTPCKKEEKPFAYRLTAVEEAFEATFDTPLVTLGREDALAEYLGCKLYVSRHHAKLTIVEGQVFIENLSRTNKTYVNNEEIADETPVLLREGDEIGLGGKLVDGKRQELAAYFRFEGDA